MKKSIFFNIHIFQKTQKNDNTIKLRNFGNIQDKEAIHTFCKQMVFNNMLTMDDGDICYVMAEEKVHRFTHELHYASFVMDRKNKIADLISVESVIIDYEYDDMTYSTIPTQQRVLDDLMPEGFAPGRNILKMMQNRLKENESIGDLSNLPLNCLDQIAEKLEVVSRAHTDVFDYEFQHPDGRVFSKMTEIILKIKN